MSHFAKVIDGTVTEVIVADQEVIDSGLFGDASLWIQTSYNTRGGIHYGQDGKPDGGIALRANYAGIGSFYDVVNDVFYSIQPYTGWVLDQTTWLWQPPIPKPIDGKKYWWDNSTLNWVEMQAPLKT